MRHLTVSVFCTVILAFFAPSFAQDQPEEEVKRIAVLQLTNRLEMSPAEIEYLTGIVRLEAAKRLPRDFLVMTQENILSLLPPEKTLEDCQGECEVDVGRLLGARYIITGEVLRFGSSLRLTLRLHDTTTGRLISSEIAKAQRLEDLESPTASSIQSLIKSLNPKPSTRELEKGSDPSPATLPAQPRAQARQPAPAQPTPIAQTPVHKRPTSPERARPQSPPSKSKDTPHPRFELQVGYSAPNCAPNGEVSCEGADDITQDQAFNDFGVQYRLLQLASLSFATDLRYTSSQLRSPFGQHAISTLSAGLVTTYKAGLWYGRFQLGAGVQNGVVSVSDARLTYRGGALRFGGEGGIMVGSFSLSLYLQNEALPKQTELCATAQGQSDCRTGWTPGVRQLGFRMGIVWGE